MALDQPTGAGTYPTVLGGLDAANFADLANRRRQASANLETALARRAADTTRINAKHEFGLEKLGNQKDEHQQQMMAGFADRNQARQPRFAGQGLRTLRDKFAELRADAESGRSDELYALEQMVQEARRRRDSEHAAVDADTVRRRTNLTDLIQRIGG